MPKKCIFCKRDSDTSKSVEHIVPESLGNTTLILPPGVVCDRCNNYFSREVEGPFLNAPLVRNIRNIQRVKSKKKRYPAMDGLMNEDVPVKIRLLDEEFINIAVEPLDNSLKILEIEGTNTLRFPVLLDKPSEIVISRFLAKMALESLALRLIDYPQGGGHEYIVEEEQLDAIRYHAKEGRVRSWPVKIRDIYDSNRHFIDENGDLVQTIHEQDFIQLENNELYFIFALFGTEFAINIGGPFIDGYEEWLRLNNYVSPLYFGNNGIER